MAIESLTSSLPIPESFAQEYLEYYRFLPLDLVDGVLRIAVAGPLNPGARVDLETSYGARIEEIPVSEAELAAAIRGVFARAETVVELVRDLSDRESSEAPAV